MEPSKNTYETNQQPQYEPAGQDHASGLSVPMAPRPPQPRVKKSRVLPTLVVVLVVCSFGLSIAALIIATNKNGQSAELKTVSDRLSSIEDEEKFPEQQIDQELYQAVFLTSGQTYFGLVSDITKDTMKLEDIYYLKTGSVDRNGNSTAATDMSLVKLGSEIHGPEDVMIIERKNVSFWENLRKDSQVSKAIDEYKKSNR